MRLPEIQAKIINAVLAEVELSRRKRFAPQTARSEGVTIGKMNSFASLAKHRKVQQAEPVIEIEQFLELGLVAADVGEPVAGRDRSLGFEAAKRHRLRIRIRLAQGERH